MTRKTPARARQDGETKGQTEREYWWKRQKDEPETCRLQPRPGHTCPACGEGTLAYDGLFVLTCQRCGYVAESGASW